MYHHLDENYRPIGFPDSEPSLPAHPRRVKSFVYGCALFAEETDIDRTKAIAGVPASRRAGR